MINRIKSGDDLAPIILLGKLTRTLTQRRPFFWGVEQVNHGRDHALGRVRHHHFLPIFHAKPRRAQRRRHNRQP